MRIVAGEWRRRLLRAPPGALAEVPVGTMREQLGAKLVPPALRPKRR